MELIWNHVLDWLSLLLRWGHFIVGVAWIGASFYFNWLENRLERITTEDSDVAGNLWAIHGGGFYHLKKYKLAPEQLPKHLHWFKWEAYMTWVTGFCLLCVVYYLNAEAYLIEGGEQSINPNLGILIGLSALVVSWAVYDLLCKSALINRPLVLAVLLFLYFSLLTYILDHFLSGRATFIHVGAAIGTIMVANVFFVIIPSQKELVSAVTQGRELQAKMAKNALLRSRHNNYLTLPVLFIMISSHYPFTYGHSLPWLVLATLSLAGVFVRHYFNIRHLPGAKNLYLLAGLAFLLVSILLTAPLSFRSEQQQAVVTAQIFPIISQRCSSCHAEQPTQPGFTAAPAGMVLQNLDQIERNMMQIHQASVLTKTMPLANLTGMTEEERDLIDQWYKHSVTGLNE